MKKLLLAMTTSALVTLMPSLSIAGASDSCKACHNGSIAPTFDTLKSKYTTVDELVAAAKNSKNDMMKAVQADEAKLKAAAEEIMKE
ncbi:hypothetical protein [Methylobacter sp. BBA5.1]|jgi:hypothetical protein|uniref:hypothetical protein n=1 Tax=Methylobacter sp. BBA5.1 TaxID=1495064 RepID=UPI0005632C2A|nr:hypothetical protein [Methylobacter sp. BBA5.1]